MSTILTEAQYLAIEREAPAESEFRDGEMLFASDVLLDRMLSPDCMMVFSSGLRIRIAATGQHTYPDCSAVRGKCKPNGDFDFTGNPALIVEVLSTSTEACDRGEKFEAYQMIPSLQDYVMVHQDRCRAEHFSKLDDARGKLRLATGNDGQVTIPPLGVAIGISELHEKVEELE